jgi:FKBP-type peptidyl-prolyl cis-trans isomerase FkpA
MLRLKYVEFSKIKLMIKKSYFSFIFLIVTGLIAFTSCSQEKKYMKTETDETNSFLSSNPGFEKKPSGMYYLDVTVGTGRQAQKHDTAFVWYTGKFLNGTIFDTNTGTGGVLMFFPVDEMKMITGFDEGITYMKQGGKAKFLIPSSLGYGPAGYYTIPGYTPLLYEVELVKVAPGPAK